MIAAMNAGLEQIDWSSRDKVLIYGIGNVGRQDDGLGVRLIEKPEAAGLNDQVTLEANYQLNIEDALLMSNFDVVLFADASREKLTEPYVVKEIGAAAEFSFTTHAMSAPAVVTLCEQLYGRRPRVFMLAMPGYEWDIAEQLSPQAQQNLDQAFQMLMTQVQCMKSH